LLEVLLVLSSSSFCWKNPFYLAKNAIVGFPIDCSFFNDLILLLLFLVEFNEKVLLGKPYVPFITCLLLIPIDW